MIQIRFEDEKGENTNRGSFEEASTCLEVICRVNLFCEKLPALQRIWELFIIH